MGSTLRRFFSGKAGQPLSWDVDPAAASFKAELTASRINPVATQLNEVLEGIQCRA